MLLLLLRNNPRRKNVWRKSEASKQRNQKTCGLRLRSAISAAQQQQQPKRERERVCEFETPLISDRCAGELKYERRLSL